MALVDSQYGYLPHEYVAIIFVVLFGLSTFLHVGQATYYRMWWLFPTACLCGFGALVGWAGRLWSSFSPSFFDPFMMQIVSTIIAPTPLIAVNFILLSWVVSRLGPCYARLTPIRHAIVFVSCDILALVVQAVGGGIASSAVDLSGANLGANVMLSGIVLQFSELSSLPSEILTHSRVQPHSLHMSAWLRTFRYHRDRPLTLHSGRGILDSGVRAMIIALAFSSLVVFIRCLAGGWHGRVLYTEVYFNVLDGGMVVLTIVSLNIAHPGRLLGSRRPVQPVDYGVKLERMQKGVVG
ncbi:RTA1 like protein-domain-containing protein [Mycena vulgaris]|nr:RTA1 like protein-domain-containing protein [Mycena vulgaris]